jgi:hypothetical protein
MSSSASEGQVAASWHYKSQASSNLWVPVTYSLVVRCWCQIVEHVPWETCNVFSFSAFRLSPAVRDLVFTCSLNCCWTHPGFINKNGAETPFGGPIVLLKAYASFILKYIFDTLQNVKKLEEKNCAYIFTCYMPTKSSHNKSMCRVACVKRQILVLKIRHFTWQFFSFLHRP